MSVPVLDIRNVTRRFGGLKAVDDVSFTVQEGEFLGIAGPNGSGKSTLFNAITRIPYGPTSGEVWFEGARIDRLPAHEIARRGLARTFQKDAEFPDLDARETIELASVYGCGLSRSAAVRETLEKIGFDPLRANLPTSELSVYERKQLMIGSALVMKPRILLLDEPASGLTRPEIAALDTLLLEINRTGVTVLLIEHVLSLLLSVARQLIVLNHGAMLAEGAPRDVMARADVIEAYLGSHAA